MEQAILDNGGDLIGEGPASEEVSPEFIHEKIQPSSTVSEQNESEIINGDNDIVLKDDAINLSQDSLEKNDSSTPEDVDPDNNITPESTENEAPKNETTSANETPEDKIPENKAPVNQAIENEVPAEEKVSGGQEKEILENKQSENEPAETLLSDSTIPNEDQLESTEITEKETIVDKTAESAVDNKSSPVENIGDNDDISNEKEKDVDNGIVKDVNSGEVNQDENKKENTKFGPIDENVESNDSLNKEEPPPKEQEEQSTNNVIQSGNLEPVSPGNEGLSPEREEDYQDDEVDNDGEVKDEKEELGPRYSPKAPVLTIQPVNIF